MKSIGATEPVHQPVISTNDHTLEKNDGIERGPGRRNHSATDFAAENPSASSNYLYFAAENLPLSSSISSGGLSSGRDIIEEVEIGKAEEESSNFYPQQVNSHSDTYIVKQRMLNL